MFAQIIRGKVSDPTAVRPVVDRWMTELGPTAKGWLGSTSGVTDDNEVFVLVRFESDGRESHIGQATAPHPPGRSNMSKSTISAGHD